MSSRDRDAMISLSRNAKTSSRLWVTIEAGMKSSDAALVHRITDDSTEGVSMDRRLHRIVVLAIGGGLLVSGASAQQYVYPAKGQSAGQQTKDEAECHQWAVKQSGFDPAKPAAADGTAASTDDSHGHDARGGRARGCARSSGRRGRRRRRGCRCRGGCSGGARPEPPPERRPAAAGDAAAATGVVGAERDVRQGACGLPRGARIHGQVTGAVGAGEKRLETAPGRSSPGTE